MEIKKYLQTSPTFSILSSAQHISAAINKAIKNEELNYLQSLILVAIFFENRKTIRPKDLAHTFQTTKSNISHSLAKLEELKLIKRQLVNGDHRSFHIFLTDSGKKKVTTLVGYFNMLQQTIEQHINELSLKDLNDKIEVIRQLHISIK